jgi:tight adherence protein C
MLILPALVFLSITSGLIALYFWITPSKTQKRLHSMSDPEEKFAWKTSMVQIIGPFAKLSTTSGNWDASPLRLKFINAGFRHPDARYIFFAAKSLLPLLFAILMYLTLRIGNQIDELTLIMYLGMSALIGCYLPNLFLYLRIKTRKREIFENFPDATDLMLVCVEAGLGLDASLNRVADEISIKSEALAEELHLTNLEIRAGGTREKALRNLALRTGLEEILTFATMLTQADKFGTSVGDSLRVFSDDLRHKRQIRAEELAAKVPTKMLFPLVVCIFPSILMVILGPAIIQIIRTVLPMINTGI